jgi:integrase
MTGHIRRRGKHSWEIKFDAGTDPMSGKRATKYVSFRGTRREAEIEAARLVTAASTGELVDQSKITEPLAKRLVLSGLEALLGPAGRP